MYSQEVLKAEAEAMAKEEKDAKEEHATLFFIPHTAMFIA